MTWTHRIRLATHDAVFSGQEAAERMRQALVNEPGHVQCV